MERRSHRRSPGRYRFAKIRLHVIALGERNVDIDSLRALAAAGDGDTIWVREP